MPVLRGPRKRDDRPLERVIQRHMMQYAARYADDLEVRKFSQGSSRFKTGDPDLLFFPRRPLVPFLMELKREGEEPTPHQMERIKRYRALGYHTYVVDNSVEGRKIIDGEMQGWVSLNEAKRRRS